MPCGISERGTGVTSIAQLHAEGALQLDEEPASALSRTQVQERLVKDLMDVFGYHTVAAAFERRMNPPVLSNTVPSTPLTVLLR